MSLTFPNSPVDKTVDAAVTYSMDNLWERQKKRADTIVKYYKVSVTESWAKLVHLTSVLNKWTQRLSGSVEMAASTQAFLVGIQITQMTAAAGMLSMQAAAAFARGHIAYGAYLTTLAGDMIGEIAWLTSQKAAAAQAAQALKVRGEAIKAWTEAYD